MACLHNEYRLLIQSECSRHQCLSETHPFLRLDLFGIRGELASLKRDCVRIESS